MRASEIKNTFKAGTFVIALFLVIVVVTAMLGKEKSIFDSKVNIYTLVKNTEGLKIGAAVRLKGISIGSIREIIIEGQEKIKIRMVIVQKNLKWIKTDSMAALTTQGMLGDKYIEIAGGSYEGESLKPEGIVPMEESKQLKDFIDKGDNILVSANRVLGHLDILLGEINEQGGVTQTLANLSSASGQLKKLLSEDTIMDLKGMAENLSKITGRVTQGPGSIHSLIYDSVVHKDLQTLLGGAQRNKVIKYFIRESINQAEQVQK